jgi:hypothetical protein
MWRKINKSLSLRNQLLLFVIAFGFIAIVPSGCGGGNEDNEGAGNDDGLSFRLEWSKESDQANFYFGGSASSGDVNGDGYSDIIVGLPLYTNIEPEEGKIIAYYGSSAGLSVTENWAIESNQRSAYLGQNISNAGDVNGDGYSDIMIGFAKLEGDAYSFKMISVFSGSPSGLSSSAGWTHEAGYSSISTAGDVNGDGFSDIIMTENGGASVYYGSSSGLSSTADWSVKPGGFSTFDTATTAGDVNGDGYSDVIVGEPDYKGYMGKVFLYYGSQSGLSFTPNWTFELSGNDYELGIALSSAGDINRDGYSDVIIMSNNQSWGLNAYVFYGSSSGLGNSYLFSLQSIEDLAFSQVKAAGDVNGDGYSDIVVSASSDYYEDSENDDFGWSKLDVFIYYGSASGLKSVASSVTQIGRKNHWGLNVSTAGDVDGDGYSEIMIGDWLYSNNEDVEGRVLVYGISSN